jgi:hypothetical protein
MKHPRAKKPRTKMSREELRKDVLEALGSYQRRGSIPTDAAAIAELLKAESDRGKVIILPSFVEDALLERVLSKFGTLTNAQRKNLTRAGAPLNSFAAITSVAEAFGLLSDYEIEVLEVLKAMRNACAHSRLEINFDTPALQDATKLLLADFFVFDQDEVLLVPPGEAFLAIFMLLAQSMTEAGSTPSGQPFMKSMEIFRLMRAARPASHQTLTERPKKRGRQAPKHSKRPPPPRSSRA